SPRQQPEWCEGSSWVAVNILAVKLQQDDVRVQIRSAHDGRIEEALASGGCDDRVRFEAGSSRQAQIQPGELSSVCVTPLPDIFDVVDLLHSLLLLLGLFGFVGEVAQLLDTGIDLLGFGLWRIAGCNDLAYRVLHGFALPH